MGFVNCGGMCTKCATCGGMGTKCATCGGMCTKFATCGRMCTKGATCSRMCTKGATCSGMSTKMGRVTTKTPNLTPAINFATLRSEVTVVGGLICHRSTSFNPNSGLGSLQVHLNSAPLRPEMMVVWRSIHLDPHRPTLIQPPSSLILW